MRYIAGVEAAGCIAEGWMVGYSTKSGQYRDLDIVHLDVHSAGVQHASGQHLDKGYFSQAHSNF